MSKETKKHQMSVISNGKSRHTHVFVGGREIKGVTSIEIGLGVNGLTSAKITVIDVSFNLHDIEGYEIK